MMRLTNSYVYSVYDLVLMDCPQVWQGEHKGEGEGQALLTGFIFSKVFGRGSTSEIYKVVKMAHTWIKRSK